MVPTVIAEGGHLCAYIGPECVYRENRPEALQRVFLGVSVGFVSLGGAEFRGEALKAVAYEAARAWRHL